MAGINRLGKAPPKPGTLRPPDPNKYRTVDMFSEEVDGDAEYLRMVQDIEDLQQQQGWLFGKGAFDKGDLLYLREEAERQRHIEIELRETESSQYAKMKARLATSDRNKKEAIPLPKSKASSVGSVLKAKPKIKLKKPIVKSKKRKTKNVDL